MAGQSASRVLSVIIDAAVPGRVRDLGDRSLIMGKAGGGGGGATKREGRRGASTELPLRKMGEVEKVSATPKVLR